MRPGGMRPPMGRHGSLFGTFLNAREMPEVTNYLVSNPMFRQLALAFHNKKQNAISDIDKYLEKELLTKEQYDAIYKAKRIDKDCSKSAK